MEPLTKVLLCFALAAAGQALVLRFGLLKNSVLAFLLPGFIFGAALLVRPEWPDIFLYAFMCELYLFLFTFIRRSVSASLLRIFEKAPLTEAETASVFCPENLVGERLGVMVQTGFLEKTGEDYRVTQKGRRLAACFHFMKNIFKTGDL